VTHSKLLDRFKCEFVMEKTMEKQGVRDMFIGSQHFGGKWACWNSRMGLRRMKST
jgi:hypothetical protein